jgi:hypothetical protein
MAKKGKGKKPNGARQTSKQHIMRGVGKYKTSSIQRKLKGRGGYAEDVGSSIGSWLGKKAGSLFRSITGLGTYAVTKNSLMANPNDPPVLTNTKGGTRIQHREYITDITGSSTFTLTPFSINPGVAATFPWLSGCALNFEEYILHGLVFEFKSTSASALNSTNTALGTVIMATEYNVVNANYTNKRDMENYVYSTSCSPDTSALHPVECARDINVLSELFIRNTIPPSGTDLRFSDIGKFQIATVGMQASANIGELWVTYDVELIKPKLPNAYTSIGPAHYAYDATSGFPAGASAAPVSTNVFGIDGEKVGLLGTGNTPVTLDENIITFRSAGRYIVLLWAYGSSVTVVYPTITLSSTVTGATIFTTGGSSELYLQSPANSTAGVTMCQILAVDVSQALSTVPATLTYSSGTYPSTITSLQLLIIPLPGGFTTRELTDMERLTSLVNSLASQVRGIRALTVDQSDDEDWKSDISGSQPHHMTNSQMISHVAELVSQANLSRPASSTPISNKRIGLP